MVKKILSSDWYKIYLDGNPLPNLAFGPLFVSNSQADLCGSGYTYFSPAEIGLDERRDNIEIVRVDDCLKRFSIEKGFYHA